MSINTSTRPGPIAQALIALHGHKEAAVAWGVGVVAFLIGAFAISDLALRVEIGFLAGSIVTTCFSSG